MLPEISPDHQQHVLRVRAQQLAKPRERARSAAETIEILDFILSGERYGVETSLVREVYPLSDLTPVPCTPPFVAGVINVRGDLVSVIDVKKFFALPERGLTELHRVIVVQDGLMVCGILCDVVTGVRLLPRAEIQQGLPTLTGIRERYLLGIAADLTVVLDITNLLRDPNIVVHEDAAVPAASRSARGES
jgi:purine-binding chemotaxis protein CheW